MRLPSLSTTMQCQIRNDQYEKPAAWSSTCRLNGGVGRGLYQIDQRHKGFNRMVQTLMALW